MDLKDTISQAQLMLTDCAISERLRRMPGIVLHPTLFNTPLIYNTPGAKKMKEIYHQYRQTARDAHLPYLLSAPTWRVDKNRTAEAGYDAKLLRDAISFIKALQHEWQDSQSPLFIGALIGPKNDCYSPDQALCASEAYEYHRWQIDIMTDAGVDCVIAQTIPAVSEGLGIARALAETETPSLISFVVNREAQVLDKTSLMEAIDTIDEQVGDHITGYMVNCVYPTFLHAETQPGRLFRRLIGIQANSSSKDHEQLDGSHVLHQDDLRHWGENMLELNLRFGMKILGGCCGTDNSYLRYVVEHRAN